MLSTEVGKIDSKTESKWINVLSPMNLEWLNPDSQIAIVVDWKIYTDPNLKVKDFKWKSITTLFETLSIESIAILLGKKERGCIRIEVADNVWRNNLHSDDHSTTLYFLNISPEIIVTLTDLRSSKAMERDLE